VFRLEAIFAKHGDCLLLHYGPDDPPAGSHPRWLLIDGGARGVYTHFLKKRLEQLADDFELDGPVPLEMVMVSHVDSDHIAGVLDIFKHLRDPQQTPKLCTVDQLWHNSFDDIIGNDDEELVSRLIADPPGGVDRDELREGAVIASVNQGRNLRNDARALAMVTNRPFSGLVQAQPGPARDIPQGEGLTFKVLAPSASRLRAYQQEWNDFLESNDLAEVEATAFNDPSAYNLASIVVLAEKDGKSMLLTGDARGDYIVNGLVEAGLMAEEARYPLREEFDSTADWRRASDEADAHLVEPFHVDLLKAPHHGSANNVTRGFFRRVTADHYVFSGNGNHHNPDPATLDMLAAARGDDAYTLHFTFTADQHETEPNATFAANLRTVHDWVEERKPANCAVLHRAADDEVYSICVDP
jgi:hypothetical protein